VQVVDQGPGQFTRHDTAHGGLVTGAPGQGKSIGIDCRKSGAYFTRDAAMPVHHGAENIKGQNLGCLRAICHGRRP